jgi:hypothetical protein
MTGRTGPDGPRIWRVSASFPRRAEIGKGKFPASASSRIRPAWPRCTLGNAVESSAAPACYPLKLAQERDPESLAVWHNIETKAVFTAYDADQHGQAAKFALSPTHQTIFEVEEGLIASLLVF